MVARPFRGGRFGLGVAVFFHRVGNVDVGEEKRVLRFDQSFKGFGRLGLSGGELCLVRGEAGGFAVEGVGVAGDGSEVLGDCGQVVCHERRMVQVES